MEVIFFWTSFNFSLFPKLWAASGNPLYKWSAP